MILQLTPVKGRIIDHLRRSHGGRWKWNYKTQTWFHESSGRSVYRCAAMAPRYDGDDSFELQLRWTDTGERAEFTGLTGCT